MKKVKLVIFDLDGTLVDAYQAIIKSFNYTMSAMGYPRKDNLTIRRAVGWGDANLLKPFLKKADLKKALNVYRRHHAASLIKGTRLFPGVRQLLGYLQSQGYYLAFASNRPTKFSLILVRHLKIDQFFDYFLCADKLKKGKPHPEILQRIYKHFSLSARDALYIGDMVIDIQAGQRARIKTIAVTTGSSTRAELKKEKPAKIISAIVDLRDML